MRNYSRVYHTSTDYLNEMPVCRLFGELADASEDLAAERREQERRMEKEKSKARSRGRSRPKRRRR